jgi:hypothetical protein
MVLAACSFAPPLMTTGTMHITITASDGTQSIDKAFFIKVVASSQVLPPEITNTDVSVVENSSSTESAKQKVGSLVIGKNDLIIDKDGIVDLDIGRCFIV